MSIGSSSGIDAPENISQRLAYTDAFLTKLTRMCGPSERVVATMGALGRDIRCPQGMIDVALIQDATEFDQRSEHRFQVERRVLGEQQTDDIDAHLSFGWRVFGARGVIAPELRH